MALIADGTAGGTKGLDEAGAFSVLATAPVCNDQTVYSCVLRPCDGSYGARAILRWDEYSRDISATAWDSFESSPAFRATRDKRMDCRDREARFPAPP